MPQDGDTVSWTDDGCRRLDSALQAKRITSTRLAAGLGVDRSLVSRWRSGERIPDVDQFAYMVDLLRVSADEILGLNVEGERSRLRRAVQAVAAVVRQIEADEASKR
jgi:transcriptional regulator with XRE-family HTH domain